MADFCTVADLAAFLQITIDASSVPALAAITEASAAIRNYCRQVLDVVADDAYTFDMELSRQTKLFLPELPVTAIDSVVEDGETLVVDDDYKLGSYGILHRIGAYWTAGIQIITVTYTHGYATIPDDIAGVCKRAAARAYQSGLRAAELGGVPGVQATSLGDYSVQFGGDQAGGNAGYDGGTLGASAAPILLPSEKRILDRYRVKGP
jgi:hypothetical protein